MNLEDSEMKYFLYGEFRGNNWMWMFVREKKD
jgi:hypothetical protein